MIMWKCPQCGKENDQDLTCNCGWARTKDYLTYRTLCPIGDFEKESLEEMLFSDEYALKKGKQCQADDCWEDAVKFYEKASEKGNLEAMKCLGYCVWKGLGTEKNLYRALGWYSKVMETGKEDVSEFIEGIYEEIKNSRIEDSCGSTKVHQIMEKNAVVLDGFKTDQQIIQKVDSQDTSSAVEEDEKKVAEAELQEAIALYYRTDMREPENFRMIQRKFQKTAQVGVPLAYTMLGVLYWRSYPYDPVYTPQTIEYLQTAMKQGCPLGGVWLAEVLGEVRKVNPEFQPERTEDFHTQAKLLGKVKALAEQENAEALYWIALELYKDEEYEEAVRWLNWAAEQEMPQAIGYLGICNYLGHGVPVNYDAAYTYFKKAERCNEGWVYCYLGDCCYHGYGVAKDAEQAAKYYEAGAVQCDVSAVLKVADMLEKGDGITKNQNRAFQLYQKAANLGSTVGKRQVGICFWNGKGVEANLSKAEQIFREASEQNDSLSEYMLGLIILEQNRGVPKEEDLEELHRLFDHAAGHEVDIACIWAARMKLFYTVDENEYMKGHQWLQKAIECEETKAKAMDILGICYAKGIGVEQNQKDAATWFQKSADLNDPEGCHHLSECYQNGTGVRKSVYEAERWQEKAAEAGNMEDAFRVAKRLQKKYGVLKEMQEKIQKYAELAYQQGMSESAVILAKNCWYRADYSLGKITEEEKEALYQKAEQYFQEAEERDVPEARAERAYFYLTRFRNKKKKEGIAILQEEARDKKPIAQYYLGLCYLKGREVKKDKKFGKAYIRVAANAGCEEAQEEVDKWILG